MKETWLELGGHRLIADWSGALIWPDRHLVIIADLHLEKGSSFASRGAFLPPYDTRATLERLASVLRRFSPEWVISLGDSFHDDHAGQRLAADDLARLAKLMAKRRWLWISGNHDPSPPSNMGGDVADEIEIDGLHFRHMPGSKRSVDGSMAIEVAGHLHPKASIQARGRRVSRPCFIADPQRLILPAFGSYTGGLDLRHPALASLYADDYRAYLLGRDRIHMVARHQIERMAA